MWLFTQEYPGTISPLAIAEIKAYERLLGAFPMEEELLGFAFVSPEEDDSEPPVAPLLGSFESLSVDFTDGEEEVYGTEGYDTARYAQPFHTQCHARWIDGEKTRLTMIVLLLVDFHTP